MRVAPRISDHSVFALRGAIIDRPVLVREPQLIKLPFALPNLPLVGPLVTPLIGGFKHTPTNTPKAGPPATSKMTDPAAPTAGNSGNTNTNTGGNGNGNGNAGGGGSGSSSSSSPSSAGTPAGGSTKSGNTPTTPPSTNSGGTPAAGNGGGASGGGMSGGGMSGGGMSGGGASEPGQTSPDSTTTTTTTTPNGNLLTSGDGTVTGAGGTTSSHGTPVTNPDGTTSPGSSGNINDNSSSTNGGPVAGGVADAGGTPNGQGSRGGSSGSGSQSTGANGLPLATGHGGSGSGGNGNNGTTGGTGNGVGGNGGTLSAGGIMAIILIIIFLCVGIAIFILRRRANARRYDSANRWWFSRNRLSQEFGDRTQIWAAGIQGTRSSFGTTTTASANHSHYSSIPPLPPMAELGRANGNAPSLIMDTSTFGGTASERRFSAGSQGSDNSQYLMVTHRDSLDPPQGSTPMSVRPFSPSESFAFPRPPDPIGDRNSAYSRPSSSGTIPSTFKGSSRTTSINTVPRTPALPVGKAGSVRNPFADDNPFADAQDSPEFSHSNASTGGFAHLEYIRRPFAPNLSDELEVAPGDSVRIIQVFDDGWTMAEKVTSGRASDTGLIPLDCLRELGQDLPTFFAEKRVSGYSAPIEGSGFHAV